VEFNVPERKRKLRLLVLSVSSQDDLLTYQSLSYLNDSRQESSTTCSLINLVLILIPQVNVSTCAGFVFHHSLLLSFLSSFFLLLDFCCWLVLQLRRSVMDMLRINGVAGKCCVCFEKLRTPVKTLPCLHPACFQCLEAQVVPSDNNGNQSIVMINIIFNFNTFKIILIIETKPFGCHFCERTLGISEENVGLAALPTSHFIVAALAADDDKDKRFDPNSVICEICEDERQASDYCKDCTMFFCLACKKAHLRLKITSRHDFISVDEALKPGASLGPKTNKCDVHPNQDVNSYWSDAINQFVLSVSWMPIQHTV
jgi:hypothetical protein